MFEVHYWPAADRVLLIHDQPAYDGPVVTELRLVGTIVGDLYASFSIALALAEAGRPAGQLFRHDPDGAIVQQALGSLRETVIRPASAVAA